MDSIPRLRRFSPCQPLASSFVYMGEKRAGPPEAAAPPPPAGDSPSVGDSQTNDRDITETGVGVGDEGKSSSSPDLKPTLDSSVSEVLSHPVTETFIVTPTEGPPPPPPAETKSNLIEVPLFVAQASEEQQLEDKQQSGVEGLDDEQKTSCGFFFKV